MSTILIILIVIVVLGLVLYLVNNYLPIDTKLKQIINAIIVIVVVIWLIKLIWPHISRI